MTFITLLTVLAKCSVLLHTVGCSSSLCFYSFSLSPHCFLSRHTDFTHPLPHPTLGLLFPLSCVCVSFPPSYAALLFAFLTVCLLSSPSVVLPHVFFSSLLLCLTPVGLQPMMQNVLLCVSRTLSLLFLQLCLNMALLTLRSAAMMVIKFTHTELYNENSHVHSSHAHLCS